MPILKKTFGAEIPNVDLARLLNPSDMHRLLDVFYREQLLVLPRQRLNKEQFRAFCAWFGKAKPHLLDHLRLQGFPEILLLSNIIENGEPIGIFEGASFWHTDVAYEDLPNSSTIAYSLIVPAQPVELEVASLLLAYEALPQARKGLIENLSVLHHYGNRDDLDETSSYAAERLTEQQRKSVRSVYQPLVLRHPVTGRKSLYAVAGSSFGIRGMPDDEAIDLLDELKHHATQDKFVLKYRYEVGDVVAWDTLSTLHKAPLTKQAQSDEDRRLLWRNQRDRTSSDTSRMGRDIAS